MKKRYLLAAVVMVACLLTGCRNFVQGSYLSDNEVISEIQKYTGKETVSIVSETDGNGRKIYRMRTSDRGLEFDLASLPVGKSGGFNFAHISPSEYFAAIQNIYKPQIEELKKDLNLSGGAIVFKNREELRYVCQKFEEMDKLYKKELEYHDAEYLKQFPADRIVISRRDNPEIKDDFSYTVPIDGTINASELEQFLLDLYKERTGKDME